ncbi:hypothetical protein SAMN02746065_13328 [Desulfocicer vacuolatum DSM 3385]|uniref:Uncharacterized protein n=1 Tax=Desulfocicer vacuolatum DSM 3385 TaxID=1121400 RepID=A0A1W2ELK6_9BACT|nr:hypothetical protein SAMN02746065_13328 [Desulfocicer vacuolatum DSM 3385]
MSSYASSLSFDDGGKKARESEHPAAHQIRDRYRSGQGGRAHAVTGIKAAG